MTHFRPQILIVACLLSVCASAQTTHVENDEIVYHNTVKVTNRAQGQLFSRAQKAIARVTQVPTSVNADSINNEISTRSSFKLNSPYHVIKTVEYTMQLTVKDGGYQYRIDSVFLKEQERGGKTTLKSSEELLKGMHITGPESAKIEKQLNEIDMNFQKLIALVNAEMKKA